MGDLRQYEIRDATRADVPAIARLAAGFAQYMRALGDVTEFKLDAQALERDGFGSDQAFRGLVVEDGGVVVGYLLYHDGYDSDAACRVLFVADLFVTPEARRQGIGAALMHKASEIAAARGARQLVWTVDQHNVEAQRFYKRIGGDFVKNLRLMCLDVE
jgi:ribosomal protein S18 acetylase RimI-like enzyme